MASESTRDPSVEQYDDEMNQQETKKPKISPEESDVVIVVGGTEFRENKQLLRSWSDFFDALFRSGMKETETNRVEFADKDPKEWELISSLVVPLSTDRVTGENVQKVLPWFHELQSPLGMKQCDEAFVSLVDSLSYTYCIGRILDLTLLSFQYDLKALDGCLLKLEEALETCPKRLKLEHLQRIIAMMVNHEKAKIKLWPCLDIYIREPLSNLDRDHILQQELLPFLLSSEIKFIDLQSKCTTAKTNLRKVKPLSQNRSQVDNEIKDILKSLCAY